MGDSTKFDADFTRLLLQKTTLKMTQITGPKEITQIVYQRSINAENGSPATSTSTRRSSNAASNFVPTELNPRFT